MVYIQSISRNPDLSFLKTEDSMEDEEMSTRDILFPQQDQSGSQDGQQQQLALPYGNDWKFSIHGPALGFQRRLYSGNIHEIPGPWNNPIWLSESRKIPFLCGDVFLNIVGSNKSLLHHIKMELKKGKECNLRVHDNVMVESLSPSYIIQFQMKMMNLLQEPHDYISWNNIAYSDGKLVHFNVIIMRHEDLMFRIFRPLQLSEPGDWGGNLVINGYRYLYPQTRKTGNLKIDAEVFYVMNHNLMESAMDHYEEIRLKSHREQIDSHGKILHWSPHDKHQRHNPIDLQNRIGTHLIKKMHALPLYDVMDDDIMMNDCQSNKSECSSSMSIS